MKKRLLLLALSLCVSMSLLLTGCCSHEWTDATCSKPKNCSTCGKTEGELISHNWINASCDTPKTCSECNKTEGEPLGHNWINASCDTPKTCSKCNKAEGDALGHKYENKYCIYCNNVDPDAFFLEDYGFINTNGMCKWLEITKYNLDEGYVEFNGNSQQEYIIIDTKVIYAAISWSGDYEDSDFTPNLYKVIDNDTVRLDSMDWAIIDRVVYNDMLVIITVRENREIWYVPEDMINLENIEEIEDDIFWPIRRYYFK